MPKNIPDVQSSVDERNLPIQKVGVRSVRHPVVFESQATVALCHMYVHLSAEQKGTHMSRFIELLQSECQHISLGKMEALTRNMCQRLESQAGQISFSFPFFVPKKAPVSQIESLMDYDVSLTSTLELGGQYKLSFSVVVPVTSLCPCSKQISSYGAHNQRSHITVTLTLNPAQTFDIAEFIRDVEALASCQLYGILKRPDEKYVTEHAYDHPKFVEDLVRDVAHMITQRQDMLSYAVESENFESIHNHSAYALIHD